MALPPPEEGLSRLIFVSELVSVAIPVQRSKWDCLAEWFNFERSLE